METAPIPPISLWRAEFTDAATEQAYRADVQGRMARQLRIALWVWATLLMLFALPDYQALGNRPDPGARADAAADVACSGGIHLRQPPATGAAPGIRGAQPPATGQCGPAGRNRPAHRAAGRTATPGHHRPLDRSAQPPRVRTALWA